MKQNYKLFLIPVALVLLSTLIYKLVKFNNMSEVDKEFEIKTPINLGKLESLDTRKVDTLQEAMILRHLYSSLVEYDNDGKVVTGVSDNFYWDGDTLVFEFGKRVKLSQGRYLDAKDAQISFNRLMMDQKNLHGDLKEILCPDHVFENVYDDCPGLKVYNNKLFVTPRNNSYNPWLLDLFASIDFRILPRENIDLKNPDVVKHTESSGPYRIVRDEVDFFELVANREHYHFHSKMPQRLFFLRNNEPILKLFISGKINLINTTSLLENEEVKAIKASRQNLVESQSYELNIGMIKFSKKAIRELKVEDRFLVGKKLAESFLKDVASYKQNLTSIFFQAYGETYLKDQQSLEVDRLRVSTKDHSLKRKVSVGATKKYLYRWGDFFEVNSDIVPFFVDKYPAALPQNERPDAYYAFTDLALSVDLATISYNMKQGTFGLFDEEADKWLKDFVATEDKKVRQEKLTDLHFNALKNCTIYPFSKLPYTIITTDDWEINQNKYLATTMLWNMRHK